MTAAETAQLKQPDNERFDVSESISVDEKDVIRFGFSVRTPISVERLPLLARIYRFGFFRRRGLSKRLIGKPSKFLFRKLAAMGFPAKGSLKIETTAGARMVSFNARNTQFSTLYCPQFRPFYEAELCAVFDRLVGPQDVFFDIGANWGWHSVMLATRPSYRGAIHAFEPFPPTFADLSGIVGEAGLDNRITCHNMALSDKDGMASMSISDGLSSGGAQLATNGAAVRLSKLDSLDLPAPKLMKIDVEDHELSVMRGAAGIIQKARPFIVFENWAHNDKPDATFAPMNFLLDAGYSFFYAGWVTGHPDAIVGRYDGQNELALVPFLPAHRYQLGDLLNIIAVPKERMEEFRESFK